jgi:hypothetical protein
MSEEAWPTPRESSREPLPRVEDLPIAEQGYEQESVRAAFDSFYRHAAQLDAALRTLEAVESFHRHAAALRSDLRSLRAAGWTQQSWNVTPAYGYGTRTPREGVPPAVWRVAGEALFLIVVAVGLGVAKLDWWLIVLVMGAALAIVLLIEWAAGREPLVMPRVAPAPPPVVEGETVGETTAEEEALGWTAFEEAQEPSDAMTMVGAPPAVEEDEQAPAEQEEQPAAEVEEPEPPAPEPEPEPASEPEPEPELMPAAQAEPEPEAAEEPGPVAGADAQVEPEQEPERRRWWRRGRPDAEPEEPPAHEPPRHVRVLEPRDETDEPGPGVDPWERGFDDADAPDEQTDEQAVPEVGEDTDEHGAAAVAADAEPARKRFRRR